MKPMPLPWGDLKFRLTDIALWWSLLDTYRSAQLSWQSIYVARQIHRLDASASTALDAKLGSLAWRGDNKGDAILGSSALDEVSVQIERFSAWLVDHPDDWLTWLYVARLHDYVQPADVAAQEKARRQAELYEFIVGETAHLLGLWRLKAGDAVGALSALTPLVDLRPLRYGSMMYLGESLLRLGNIVAAEKAFLRASHSNNPLFLSLLADKVFKLNYWSESLEILKKAISVNSKSPDLWLQLARMQAQVFQLTDCRESLDRAEALGTNDEAELLRISLAGQYGDAKSYFEALEKYFRSRGSENTRVVSSILMTSLYRDDFSAEEIASMHLSYCKQWDIEQIDSMLNLKKRRVDKPNLRIGYVTGDLHRQHPVNIFMLPLFEQQKTSALEVYIYHTGSMHDVYTDRARQCANHWVEAGEWDDLSLHKKIVSDEIDILMDLAGHTASHRLGVFAKRSAPVQMSFLGYPHSTGLKSMDYILGDSVVAPFEQQQLFSEEIVQMPGSVFCWAPVDDYPLPPPRAKTAPIVFGSFNNALKLSPKTILLWAKVLLAVPNSKLLLKAPSYANPDVCQRFRTLFQDQGIDAGRLEFRGPSELSVMMQEYGDIDIALDPLSYNGGTTSLQALWMGVPLVTMQGDNFVRRMGSSFLSTLGRSEWIAENDDSYVAIVAGLAESIQEIRLRRSLSRDQMKKSQLCDIKAYAQNFEMILHRLNNVKMNSSD